MEMEMEEEEEEELKNCLTIPNPMSWFIKIIILQADLFHNCLLVLFSPFIFLFSLFSEIIRSAEETKRRVDSAVHAAARVPSTVVHGSSILLKKLVVGFLGAVYMCMVLIVVVVMAVILGVGLVKMWLEEPVLMRQRLHFDYTEIHPSAVFAFDGDDGFEGHKHMTNFKQQQQHLGVPVGHTFYVSLAILMPESDYNRQIGVFQVTAEIISTNGNTMAKSSHPCMLRFRSWPIRMMRTLAMGLPLLLGITAETQRLKISMLRHKEGFPRSKAIRLSLVPRAGTDFLPQLYNAEILLKSELPWEKELVRRWKWTFYVWASLYAYLIQLMILLCCFRPLIFPRKVKSCNGISIQKLTTGEASVKPEEERSSRDEKRVHVSETLRRWQENRSRRKAMLLHRDRDRDDDIEQPLGSGASSISLTREDTIEDTIEDDDSTTGDSESVCYKGDVD